MNFEEKIRNFINWLPQMGIRVSSGVEICDTRPIHGRGLVALRDFEENELIFSIPRSALLNTNTAREFLNSPCRRSIQNMPEWLSLSAILLAEDKNENSRWGPYLSLLPKQLDSLIFWSLEELQELQASAVLQKIGKETSEEIISKFLPFLGLKTGNIQSIHLPASIVMAYAFDVPESASHSGKNSEDEGDDFISDREEETTLSMVPFADLLNADVDKNNARLFCDSEELEMRTIKFISAGEEIYNDYGALPQSDLLRRYGYVADSYARYNVVEISAKSALSIFQMQKPIQFQNGQILEPLNSQDFEDRLAVALRENVYEEAYDISHSSAEVPGIPDEMLALIYIFLLDPTYFRAIKTSVISLPSRSKLSTLKVGQAIAFILRERQSEYATTLEMDEELLRSPNITGRRMMAVKVRLGEKVILRDSIHEALSFLASDERMMAKFGGCHK